MHLEFILKLLALLQFIAISQNSHVQQAKQHIRAEVRSALHSGRYQPSQQHYHQHRNRWSGRRKSIERHHQFTRWSAWSACGGHDCVKRRERYCKVKRKCGFTKHVEEHKCLGGCHAAPAWQETPSPALHHSSNAPQSIIINAAAAQLPQPSTPPLHLLPHFAVRMPVLQEFVQHHHHHQPVIASYDTTHDGSDFYALKMRPSYRKERKPIYIQAEDYDELEHELDESAELQPVLPSRLRKQQRRQQHRPQQAAFAQRNLQPPDDGIEGDLFQYEDFDFEQDTLGSRAVEQQYSDLSYEDLDYAEQRNSTLLLLPPSREKATPDALLPRHRRLYSKWSRWTKCSPKCTTRRYKKCRMREHCGREVLREIAYCYTEGSFCQQWLQAQMQKSPPYELRPAASRRLDVSSDSVQSNAIVSDFIMNGKGYRGPEYAPQKLKCGIASMRSGGKRHMYNMLKIIGGKAARKGEWPWQVAIFNRFKEAFCGGTLIAPQWVLTAAHCVRKVLYVRIGEHNLDYEDGTEQQLRVLKSFKHPNFDKKTVDSDVALLKLPKLVNATSWIGFSCLPHPYQPLPRNVDCTVIGWGKRRNRDVAGTSVLHQAEVPIIPMDNCRSVYHDYTITKNMFCAGHKRGRIDTCAGDSGGPLLCRDKTKPNHPWTIFGITSFGDGCAKRNKFGIYAKVSNYVDWVWSVINCNGNCKMQQRSYGN